MPKQKKEPFTILLFDRDIDKWIEVAGPYINIRVDYDDVSHKRVEKELMRMVDILNAHWDDKNSQPLTKEQK